MKKSLLFQLAFFCIFLLASLSCRITGEKLHYPHVKKVAAITMERFDSNADVLRNYYSEIPSGYVESLVLADSNNKKHPRAEQLIVNHENISENVFQIFERHKSIRKKTNIPVSRIRSNASLAETTLPTFWSVIMGLAGFFIIVWFILFLYERIRTDSCLGCGILILLTGLAIVVLLGVVSLLI